MITTKIGLGSHGLTWAQPLAAPLAASREAGEALWGGAVLSLLVFPSPAVCPVDGWALPFSNFQVGRFAVRDICQLALFTGRKSSLVISPRAIHSNMPRLRF